MENKLNVDKLERFYSLQKMKKEMEQEIDQLKKEFNEWMDVSFGENRAGKLMEGDYVLQRQVRKTEKYDEARAVERLEELQLEELIETVKRPNKTKIQAAVELGLIRSDQLEDLIVRQYAKVLAVKRL